MLFTCTAGLYFLAPEKQLAAIEFHGYTNLVTRSRFGNLITNRYATFILENRGDRALTYTGTPLPNYNIEHLQPSGWKILGDLLKVEDLATLLPGERLDFRVYLPDTTNQWRVAVNCLRPSRVPYPFRRFFQPTLYPLVSGEVRPWQEAALQLASATNSLQTVGEHLTK